jgi:hypothetical protein
MKWTGIVFPNHPEYELYGDSKSIYEQIITINPAYNGGYFDPTNQTVLLTKGTKSNHQAAEHLQPAPILKFWNKSIT